MISSRNLTLLLGFFFLVSSVGLAQVETPTRDDAATRLSQQQRGRVRRTARIFRRRVKLQNELGLTETQRQQVKEIRQRQFESTRAQREELMQLGEKRRLGTLTAEEKERARSLHREMRALRLDLHTELDGVLTPEQRAKVEELRKLRKKRREQRIERRPQRRIEQPF